MTASTITFAVQLGSDGFAIARAVAERLNYHYLDWEVTSRAAAEAGVSPETIAAAEQNRSTLQSIVQSLLASSSLVSEEVSLYSGPSATDMSTAIGALNTGGYRNFVESVVRQLADAGEAVIVGHAGQVILRDEQHVLKVLVCGSQRRRAERLAAETSTSVESALSTVLSSDKERRAFFKKAYGVELLFPQHYDISVNTDRLSFDQVVDNIVTYAESLPGTVKEYTATAATAGGTGAEAELSTDGVPATKQKDALLRARQSLETAVQSDAADTKAWAREVSNAVDALRRVFDRHVREAEAADGSLNDVVRVKPRLARRVAQIRDEHAIIRNALADFVLQLKNEIAAGDVAVERLKERAVRAGVSLRMHDAKGTELLHEAYLHDDGGEQH
jgi:cytidylate kinase